MAKLYYADVPPATRPLTGPQSLGTELQPPKWIVKNMYRFNDPEHSTHCISALRIMVDGTPREDVDAVLKACGVEAIIFAMQRHPDDAGVQVMGSGTLSVIARSNDDAKLRILEAGGLLEVGAAVQRCRQSAGGSGEEIDGQIVCEWSFCAQCLREIAGKNTNEKTERTSRPPSSAGSKPACSMRPKKVNPARLC
jgi:hypothetical protein